MSEAKALRDVLRDATPVTALTGKYLSRASIFAESVTPADFIQAENGPCVLIGAPTAALRNDTTNAAGGVKSFRVRIYAPSDAQADALADAVEVALYQSSPVVPGLVVHGVIADPASITPTETPSVKGRQIPTRLIYERA